MTVAFLTRGALLAGFIASGHASFGRYGKDIVCAGASAVLLTAAAELKRLDVPVRIAMRNGFLTVRVRPTAVNGQRVLASALLRAAHTGVSAIADRYGKRHVRVKVRTIHKREV